MNRAKPSEIGKMKIAVPGELTSAYLALRIFNSDFRHVVVPFDEIIDAVKRARPMPDCSSTKASFFTIRWAWTRCSISANGGTKRPDCRCRWAATRSAAILGKDLMKQVSKHLHQQHSLLDGKPRGRSRLRDAVCTRYGARTRRPLCRDVGQRPHARLRRPRPRGRQTSPRRRPQGRHHPAQGQGRFCRVARISDGFLRSLLVVEYLSARLRNWF